MQTIFRVMLALLCAMSTGALAQTSRAEFAQMLDILRKTPKDDALREQIVRAAVALKPAPAIPEEARRELIRGNTALEEAVGVEDYARAAGHYEGALALAPWWGPAYLSLARAQELQLDYRAAEYSLKFYMLAAASPDETRKAQDYLYTLQYKQERADKAQGDYDAKYGWLSGQWTLTRKSLDKDGYPLKQTDPVLARSSVESGSVVLKVAADTMEHDYAGGGYKVSPTRVDNSFRVSYDASGQLILELYGEPDPTMCPAQYGWHQVDFELGPDRRTITATQEQRYRLPSCELSGLSTTWVFERVQ
jgi:hypothetical protein